jgi:hypothetical protein
VKDEYQLGVVRSASRKHYVTLISPDGEGIQSWELGGEPCDRAIMGKLRTVLDAGSEYEMLKRGPIVAKEEAQHYSADGCRWIDG